jgi:signal transduction histidine kinase
MHLAVYRILQEALSNILKHAEATAATVEILQNETLLYLSISDNGKGCETLASSSGIGITNMRTRAENLNGTFVIKSTAGKGCEIHVKIPLGLPQ